ncbi:hypothetical protein MMC07_004957 [Pseudocyphellaria aurata]|nr:hypothetical protein [Pseudocyphellaria aurata]
MGSPSSDGHTVRLRNLPPETVQSCVRRFFDSRMGEGTVIAVNGVGNIVDQVNTRTKQTTVTFKNCEYKKKALRDFDRQMFRPEFGESALPVSIDDDFIGLTTLFESKTGITNLDIVVLHGLAGHAWNTFASPHQSDGLKESCWLKDELPTFLEDQEGKSLYPRVMTFGYHANIWTNATIDGIDAPVSDLVHSLKVARHQDPNRPLIFIGHSLGGIVIKQVVDFMVTSEKQKNPDHITPIKACLFLAVPHRGTGNADSLNHFLKRLDKLLPPGTGPNRRFLKDLEKKNSTLANITDRFIQLLNGNGISVISCYENKDYAKGKGKIVSKESAILDYAGRQEPPHPIDANHSDVARFGNNRQHPFMDVASELANIAYAANYDLARHISSLEIGSDGQNLTNYVTRDPETIPNRQQQQSSEPVKEPDFFMLTRYTTILLVDDSSSMEDLPPQFNRYPWTDTTEALAECAKLILGAGGRLKIHFFNSRRSRDNISGVEEVRTLCGEITPRGDTPTYQRLKDHLDPYVSKLQKLNVEQRVECPGLNLLVFTDGAPEGGFDDIEETIVETAEDLDAFRPKIDKYKVGIQFVQIGNDKGVQDFFKRIDDEIKGDHHLKRDIVDTTRYNPETATAKTFMKIVLGAINKKIDEESIPDPLPQSQSMQPRYIPEQTQGRNSPYESTRRENSFPMRGQMSPTRPQQTH